ncbi:hypothetical protein EJ04DRAFT_560705 [Polyplosphaeria fusca]|uniref:Uncharacterized protein n=1 Tax=Polyplosphaeria fusca TaxID=682080 RepID=A0A9P4R7S8_9PLEO|nr:hypothetical protein EJ04DRAFT_560705 [Polyplosphaeria fusca]
MDTNKRKRSSSDPAPTHRSDNALVNKIAKKDINFPSLARQGLEDTAHILFLRVSHLLKRPTTKDIQQRIADRPASHAWLGDTCLEQQYQHLIQKIELLVQQGQHERNVHAFYLGHLEVCLQVAHLLKKHVVDDQKAKEQVVSRGIDPDEFRTAPHPHARATFAGGGRAFMGGMVGLKLRNVDLVQTLDPNFGDAIWVLVCEPG